MSGILASSMIAKNGSCKLYTNTSGNAASVTIHTKVPSLTENACLSIKVSGTDACICTNAVDSTANSAPIDTVAIVLDGSNNWDGYTCLNNATNPAYIKYSLVECDATVNHAFTNPQVRSPCYTRPTSDTFFSEQSYCCPRTEVQTCGYCCDTLLSIMMWNQPNFHTADSGEKHTLIPIACCNIACTCKYALAPFKELAGISCCGVDLTTTKQEYKTYLGKYCQDCACPSVCTYRIHCDQLCNQSGYVVSDLWSDFGVTHSIECFTPPDTTVRHNVFLLDLNCEGCKPICNMVLLCCCSDFVIDDNLRKIIFECCNCCACCCNANFVSCYATLPSKKPVMQGCDVTMYQGMVQGRTAIIMYPYECYSTYFVEDKYCAIRALQAPFYNFGRIPCDSCNCYACCVVVPEICNLGAGAIKWLWYNPYENCNYFAAIGNDTDRRGIFTFEPRCYSPYFAQANCTCNYTRFPLADYIETGFIQKAAELPAAWERFVCIKTRGGCCTIMSNPTLTGSKCWAVWAQCFNWGDTSLDSTGWNGCFLRYHSSDLKNWELTTDQNSLSFDSGSGDTLCNVTKINTGTDFSTSVNYFFNSANCVPDDGLLEYKTSANRMERTGIVIGNGDSLYVNNEGTKTAVTVWGYDE